MNYNEYRRKPKPVQVGRITVGGNAPVSVQSMTNTKTSDIEATVAQIRALQSAGCDIVRMAVPDADAVRAFGVIREQIPDFPLVADIHFDYRLAVGCAEAGADFVGTTMRGYTPETTGINDVDFGFIAQLARECPAKVIAEGHIHTPEQAVQALYAGAFALVVGGAITRPAEITARYTAAINNHK